MLTSTMTSADQSQFERFINTAIAHRDWLNSEASKMIAGYEDCESNRRAIKGAIRELDELICRTYLEPEKTSFPSG
jgi:hypothetical protein